MNGKVAVLIGSESDRDTMESAAKYYEFFNIDMDLLIENINDFHPTLIVFSWRDIQIYAPVDGRGGNPLQNSFEVFYAKNPLRRLKGALGGVQLMQSHYGEIWRNQKLIRRGLNCARIHQNTVRIVIGGGAVSVFYEQLGKSLRPSPRHFIINAIQSAVVANIFPSGQSCIQSCGFGNNSDVFPHFVDVYGLLFHNTLYCAR